MMIVNANYNERLIMQALDDAINWNTQEAYTCDKANDPSHAEHHRRRVKELRGLIENLIRGVA
jgi:hypothetical protein